MSLDLEKPKWVALYTHPRAEKMVSSRLEERGIENYLPIRTCRHTWSDRIKTVSTPLIPGYLFARITLRQVTPVREVDGVSIVVGYHNMEHNETIPDQQILDIRHLVAAEDNIQVVHTSDLLRKQPVRIIDGRNKGMVGWVVQHYANGNFAISIREMGLSLVVEIADDLIKPLTNEEIAQLAKKWSWLASYQK